ncbi:MAG: DUF86 domain-containing protein [Paludibacteraceae bacterium]|nr:DUF86 domain-containing protein [Paludibacteraceae bacterium]
MREPIRDKERLQHILNAIDIIIDRKEAYSVEQLQSDPIIFYGFVKQVEIIGEAVYKLTYEFKDSHSDIEWDAIEGMRHVLVHGYYAIQPDKLWKTINEDIPLLKPQILKCLDEL